MLKMVKIDGWSRSTNTNFLAVMISLWHRPQILKTSLSEHTDWDARGWQIQGFPQGIFIGEPRVKETTLVSSTGPHNPKEATKIHRVHGEWFSQYQECLTHVVRAATMSQCFRILKAQKTLRSRDLEEGWASIAEGTRVRSRRVWDVGERYLTGSHLSLDFATS